MKFPKSLLLAAGILLAGSIAASARPAVVTTDLNVRSGPGTGYPVISSIPTGASVNVGRCTGSWCQVGGGWASARYLAFGGGGTRVVVQPEYYDGYYGGGGLGVGLAAGYAAGYWGSGGYWGRGYYGRPGYRAAYWRNGAGWGDGPRAERWRNAYNRNGAGWGDGPRADRWRNAYNRNGPGWGDGPRANRVRTAYNNRSGVSSGQRYQYRQNISNARSGMYRGSAGAPRYQYRGNVSNARVGMYRPSAGAGRAIYRPTGGMGGGRFRR